MIDDEVLWKMEAKTTFILKIKKGKHNEERGLHDIETHGGIIKARSVDLDSD